MNLCTEVISQKHFRSNRVFDIIKIALPIGNVYIYNIYDMILCRITDLFDCEMNNKEYTSGTCSFWRDFMAAIFVCQLCVCFFFQVIFLLSLFFFNSLWVSSSWICWFMVQYTKIYKFVIFWSICRLNWSHALTCALLLSSVRFINWIFSRHITCVIYNSWELDSHDRFFIVSVDLFCAGRCFIRIILSAVVNSVDGVPFGTVDVVFFFVWRKTMYVRLQLKTNNKKIRMPL